LPELSQFNTKVANNAGGFGDEDMFKNIKWCVGLGIQMVCTSLRGHPLCPQERIR
jgi:hypothetical protein